MGNNPERVGILEGLKRRINWDSPRGRKRFFAHLAGIICFTIGLAGNIGIAIETETEVMQKAPENCTFKRNKVMNTISIAIPPSRWNSLTPLLF